jgi:hypothetical protein
VTLQCIASSSSGVITISNFFNSFLFDFAESLFFSAFMALAFSELLRDKKEEIVQT